MTQNINLSCALRKRPVAVATVLGSPQYSGIRGRALFYNLPQGVLVKAEVTGLPKGEECSSPIFAMHIHSGEECKGNADNPFFFAGTHYNPNSCEHPYHTGDMPPLFGVNGTALSCFLTDRFNINEVIGRAVIIHAKPDDFMTEPSGNSGEKIACGIIKPVGGFR